jgi:hypothetical protein
MDILRIDASDAGLEGPGGLGWKAALGGWLQGVPQDATVTILVHGYRYAPGHDIHDPHDLIYALKPSGQRPRAISWPAHLGGHVIAFGWPARGSIWRASREARIAGQALAAVAGRVGISGRRVAFVAHSLGARAVTSALSLLPGGVAEAAILMTAAVFVDEARAALRTEGGAGCRVLNVTTRENLLFDLLFAIACARPFARTIAQGMRDAPTNWIDLRIDCRDTRRRLGAFGWPIRPPVRRICHWSAYLRPGLFPIYRAFLSGRLSPARLSAMSP